MKNYLVIAASTLALAACGTAMSQQAAFPTKPIRLILGTAPGGAVDALGRIMASELSKGLGQPVVVDNRGGANGNIAGEAVAQAAADGYTLLQTSGGTITTNPHLYEKMSFDPLKDLTPVTQVALNPLWLVVRSALPVKSMGEFVSYLKANPGKATYASAGNGSALHIAQEAFARAAGVNALQVPYKGAGPALADVVSGQVDFVWDPGPGLRQLSGGRIKILAVGSPKRIAAAPDVPTVAELGYPGFNTASAHALLAPANTPKEIIERLNREAVKVLQTPEVRERMHALGVEPIGNSPEAAAADIRAESARLGKLVREANIRLE
jgi:tripartite-type tricarboxylate transporter receptor subunit TctC